MGTVINTNTAANSAYVNLSKISTQQNASMQKLSSGLRINSAADDAAGLSIAEGLKSQANGSDVAKRNAADGISVIQTADGALTEVTALLQRARDLAVQGGNDSNNGDARAAINKETASIGAEITRISAQTNFNGINLLDGSKTSLTFQVGSGSTANDQLSVALTSTTGIGTTVSGLTIATAGDSLTSITAIDAALKTVSGARGDLGAGQNRLQSVTNSLQVSSENLNAAQSNIRDTDMAAEMVKYTKSSILAQAATAMLAQANQSGQGVLKLLG
jgi:flagellin